MSDAPIQLTPEEKAQVDTKQKINAIVGIRLRTGCNLRRAMEAVRLYENSVNVVRKGLRI